MIIGAHSIIYSSNADADRAFLRDVLQLPSVDVGGGWLIFGLPPAEVAVHPSDGSDAHELYLMCEDVNAFVAALGKRGVACGPVLNRGWGLLVEVGLPSGSKLGVYQPRHARPKAMRVPRKAAKASTARKPAKTAKRAAAKAKPSSKTAAKKTRKR